METVDAVARKKREHTFRGVAEKRRIVAETLQSGVSVSSVARAHGVNANQVFQWRKLYRDGLLDAAASGSEMRLLPVSVSEETEGVISTRPSELRTEAVSRGSCSPGAIELQFDWGQLRIVGAVDAEALRTVLGCLLL